MSNTPMTGGTPAETPEASGVDKGVFVSVGGGQASGVVYETYLVQ